MLEETTSQNLTFDDMVKKRSSIYRKINDKADQIMKFLNLNLIEGGFCDEASRTGQICDF